MKHAKLPEAWFEPLALLNERDEVQISILDDDFDERYENKQGILIPVASSCGKILSEKRQKAILRHFLTGFSRTKFEYMIGVLRRDPDETVTQVRRWCDFFKRITDTKSDMAALDRVGVRAFAIAAPRGATDKAVQKDAFTSVLNTGVPSAIYRVPALSKAEIDQELIKELVSKYDNLILVFDESDINTFRAGDQEVSEDSREIVEESYVAAVEEPTIEITIEEEALRSEDKIFEAIEEPNATAFELVGEPITREFVLVGDAADVTPDRQAAIDFKEAEIKTEYKEIADEFALVPLRDAELERGLVPYVVDGRYLAPEEITEDASGTNKEASKNSKQSLAKRLASVDKIKILRRVITAELIAGVLLGVVLVDTVQVQAAERRSDALAVRSAEMFMESGQNVMDEAHEIVSNDAEEAIIRAHIDKIRNTALNLEYIEEERDYDIEESETYKLVQSAFEWDGAVLNKTAGTVTGPNGRETYYNLNMSGVVNIMRRRGNTDTYWVRSDGCKMLGNYIMVAANLDVHPRGSIVRCSRGLAIVCDTGGFAVGNPQQLDVATAW